MSKLYEYPAECWTFEQHRISNYLLRNVVVSIVPEAVCLWTETGMFMSLLHLNVSQTHVTSPSVTLHS